MGFMDQLWGRIKIKSLECTKLYLPNNSGAPTLVEATADDLNSLTPSGVGDGTITNTKLATDVKVGSLAALTTTAKGSVQAAINEVDANCDAKYTKPALGIPKSDLVAAVQTSLGKADTALQVGVGVTKIARKTIQLAGGATPVLFQDDAVPFITGIAEATDMHTVGHNGTIKIQNDADGDETATLECTAGTHTGGGDCSTDMTGNTDTKLKIRANGDETWHTITCDWSGCDSGAAIATQLQTKVRALGATHGYSRITVAFSSDHLVFTSLDHGTASTIEIDRAADHDCCDDLDIGPDNGVTAVGTGDVANIYAVTPEEIAALINGDMSNVVADASSGTLVISGTTEGRAGKVTAGNGTLNTLCGIPNGKIAYGAQGMGLDADWDDALYDVFLTYKGAAAASKDLGWASPTVEGFTVTCETGSDTGYVSVLVVG
jgi:hypothetical protein